MSLWFAQKGEGAAADLRVLKGIHYRQQPSLVFSLLFLVGFCDFDILEEIKVHSIHEEKEEGVVRGRSLQKMPPLRSSFPSAVIVWGTQEVEEGQTLSL